MANCVYDVAWIGPCDLPATVVMIDGMALCQKHYGKTCVSCGLQANRSCEARNTESGGLCDLALCHLCQHAGWGMHELGAHIVSMYQPNGLMPYESLETKEQVLARQGDAFIQACLSALIFYQE